MRAPPHLREFAETVANTVNHLMELRRGAGVNRLRLTREKGGRGGEERDSRAPGGPERLRWGRRPDAGGANRRQCRSRKQGPAPLHHLPRCDGASGSGLRGFHLLSVKGIVGSVGHKVECRRAGAERSSTRPPMSGSAVPGGLRQPWGGALGTEPPAVHTGTRASRPPGAGSPGIPGDAGRAAFQARASVGRPWRLLTAALLEKQLVLMLERRDRVSGRWLPLGRSNHAPSPICPSGGASASRGAGSLEAHQEVAQPPGTGWGTGAPGPAKARGWKSPQERAVRAEHVLIVTSRALGGTGSWEPRGPGSRDDRPMWRWRPPPLCAPFPPFSMGCFLWGSSHFYGFPSAARLIPPPPPPNPQRRRWRGAVNAAWSLSGFLARSPRAPRIP